MSRISDCLSKIFCCCCAPKPVPSFVETEMRSLGARQIQEATQRAAVARFDTRAHEPLAASLSHVTVVVQMTPGDYTAASTATAAFGQPAYCASHPAAPFSAQPLEIQQLPLPPPYAPQQYAAPSAPSSNGAVFYPAVAA